MQHCYQIIYSWHLEIGVVAHLPAPPLQNVCQYRNHNLTPPPQGYQLRLITILTARCSFPNNAFILVQFIECENFYLRVQAQVCK
jgi:hypothetical protein